MGRILVVDDEPAQREIMREILTGENHEVVEAGSVDEAESAVRTLLPDVVLTDLKMPNRSGLVLVERLAKAENPPALVVITAFGTIENAVKAVRLGAYDYLSKPIDGDELLLVVNRALEKVGLRNEARRLREELRMRTDSEIIAESEIMRKLLETAEKVAHSEATVLVRGESGTGKEKIARLIHAKSLRNAMPFQSINCAAFPETLLESELFGHEKGAFTGAYVRKIGLIEAAMGGTLFLDEIGDMAINTQTKILRVLQEKEVRRVGGNGNVKVDVRIVAATNRNLEEAIRLGRFREDLFYRLNVIPLAIPPLRDRVEDIPALVLHFLKKSGRNKTMDKDALDSLKKYYWPGNVRELEAVLERVTILSPDTAIHKDDLPLEMQTAAKESLRNGFAFELPAEGLVFEELEYEVLKQAMIKAGGNMTEAARLLGMNYRAFRYRSFKFGIVEK
ncbi:MAG: sigma-54 dependent transcriptional regulator [Fibrobacteria bacterium]